MAESTATPGAFLKYGLRYLLPALLFGITTWMGLSMLSRTHDELLWGWRPFFLLVSFWGAMLSVILSLKPENRERRRRWLLTTLSGVLMSLSFPPSPLTGLAFIGLVPLLMADRSLRESLGKRHGRKAFSLAFNAFFIWNIFTTWWVLNTSFLPGIVANVANAALLGLVFIVFHHARNVLPERVHPFALAAFWIAFEYLHMQWEISWPWLTLGNTFAQFPSWVQWYSYTGVFGGSLWILLSNYWVYNWWKGGRRPARLVGPALWIVLPIAWSMWTYAHFETEGKSVEVVIVQPNFEPHYEKFALPQQQQLERFLQLSREALTDSTRYLVFPETSFGLIDLAELNNDQRILALRGLIEQHPDLHIVSGLESFRFHETYPDLKSVRVIYNRSGEEMYVDVQNSAIEIDKRDSIPVYFKSKLVPGAESFPFRDYLPFLKPLVDMLQGSVAGLTKQDERAVFGSKDGVVAPVICYESVYGEYVGEYVKKGADMIFIMTNDGWWDKTPGHVQHLKIGALRAIEHRRPIARSANTGISCFINARGEILQPTEYGVEAAIRGPLTPGHEITFYTRWGDIIARIAIFLAVLLIALTITRSIVPAKGL